MGHTDRHAALLEGITVQQAGELIFDAGSTRDLRHLCFSNYRAALGNFAFSFVLTDRFGVSGDLPKVGNEEPGRHLLNHSGEIVTDVEQYDQFKPSQLLEPGHHRRLVRSHLALLGETRYSDQDAWNGWILREARSYLGNDASLWTDVPSQYKFFKTPKPYFHDVGLQGFIPREFFEPLADSVELHANEDCVPRLAIEEFVKRSALTHVTIHLWYERVWRQMGDLVSTVVPSPTRKTIVFRQKGRELFAEIETILTPNILLMALESPARGLPFLEQLRILREQLLPLRERLSTAMVASFENERPTKLKKIWKEVRDRSMAVTDDFVPFRLKEVTARFTLNEILEAAATVAVGRHVLRNRYLLHQIVTPKPDREKKIKAEMERLFPELV